MAWLSNFYLIGPALGWVWFAEQTNPIVQLAAHTIAREHRLDLRRREPALCLRQNFQEHRSAVVRGGAENKRDVNFQRALYGLS